MKMVEMTQFLRWPEYLLPSSSLDNGRLISIAEQLHLVRLCAAFNAANQN
jgi:hypothetical protein